MYKQNEQTIVISWHAFSYELIVVFWKKKPVFSLLLHKFPTDESVSRVFMEINKKTWPCDHNVAILQFAWSLEATRHFLLGQRYIICKNNGDIQVRTMQYSKIRTVKMIGKKELVLILYVHNFHLNYGKFIVNTYFTIITIFTYFSYEIVF